jgi:hypothetical protein
MGKCALVYALAALASVAAGQSITTTFVSNNGGSSGWMNQFDVGITNPLGLNLEKIDVNCGSAAGTAITIEVYTKTGTYVGFETNPAAWTLTSTGAGVSAGQDVPTPVDITDFVAPPGTYGCAVRMIGGSPRYTNGTGSNQYYSNADINLTLGNAVGGLFTGTVFTPRVWNGTIYYTPVPEPATIGLLALGLLAIRRR